MATLQRHLLEEAGSERDIEAQLIRARPPELEGLPSVPMRRAFQFLIVELNKCGCSAEETVTDS
jgi:hypothetical protein